MNQQTQKSTDYQIQQLTLPTHIMSDKYFKVKKIFHISDIHINLYKRHEEYEKVFSNLYQFISSYIRKHNYKIYETVIVITGDILHSKTELSPECVNLTYEFLYKLSVISPTIIIAGNHDANLNNKNRMDALSPIVSNLEQNDRIPFFYLKETNAYQYGNIIFGVTSVFNYSVLKSTQLPKPLFQEQDNKTPRFHKIALFHGRLNGAETDLGMKLEGEEDINQKTIGINSFKGYDLTLLGDIHKFQYLTRKKNIAYAGSLIQQNHGEKINNHGVLVWNLTDYSSKLYPIVNEYGYVTIRISANKSHHNLNYCLTEFTYDSLIKYLENEEKISKTDNNLIKIKSSREVITKISKQKFKKIIDPETNKITYKIIKSKETQFIPTFNHQHQCQLPHKCRIRLEYEDLSYYQIEKILALIKKNHKILETQYQEISVGKNKKAKSKSPLNFNVSDNNCQDKFLEKYFNQVDIKEKISSNELQKIKEINQELNQQLQSSQSEHQNWKIKYLEFDNLFSYGPNNKVNFDTCKGTVGIIAPNHTGKSALIDIILYALFNKFSRKGDIKDMINIKADYFNVYLVFQIENKLYHIIKKGECNKGKSKKKSELPVKVDFYTTTLDNNNKISLQKDKPKDTMTEILKYIGNYEDMILTNVSLQGDNTNFIDITDTPRKQELEKILKINIFSDLKDLAGKILHEKKTRLKILKEKDIVQELEIILNKIQESQLKLKKIQSIQGNNEIKITQYKETLINIQNEINQMESKLNKSMWEEIINFISTDTVLSDDIGNYMDMMEKYDWKEMKVCLQNGIEHLKSCITNIKNKIESLSKDLNEINKDTLELDEINEKLNKLYHQLIPINVSYESLNKKGLKLESNMKEMLNNIKQNEEMLEELPNKIVELNNILDNIDSNSKYFNKPDKTTLKQVVNLLNDHNNSDTKDIKELIEKEIERDESKILKIKKEIKNKESKIPEIRSDILDLKHQIEQISLKIKTIQEQKKQHKNNEKIQIDIDKYKTIQQTLQKIHKKEKRKHNIQKTLLRLTKYDSNVKQYLSQSVKYKIKVLKEKEVLEQLEKLQNENDQIKEASYILKSEMKHNKLQINILNQEKESIRNLEKDIKLYKNYLNAVKNIPFLIIQDIKPILENMINGMLSNLVDFTISFDIKDNKYISIYLKREIENNRREILLSNSSGFEKFISGLFIRVALINISNLPKPNFLFVDEGWSCFDSHNINNVGTIFDYLKTKFDFILTISHIQELRGHLDKQMVLTRDKKTNLSYVNFT